MPKADSDKYEIVDNGKERYVAYKVMVRVQNEHWFVIRRYKEFRALYDILRRAYPEARLKIPPKKLFGNFSQSTINERVQGLNDLVSQLVNTGGVMNEECAKEFFRTNDARNQPIPVEELPNAPDSPNDDEDPDNFAGKLGKTFSRKMTPENFEFMKVIGKGSFGRVYLSQHKETGKIYAVKVLVKNKLRSAKERHHLMSERNVLLNNLQHPFLVALHYSFQTASKLYFVLDYVNGGELFFHLQKEKRFEETRARYYAAEIACALGYLHSRFIIYRDLKPENLLLDRYGHIVITDFGLAKERMDLQEGGCTRTFCGTPEYLAPEVLLKRPYTYTLDWWCLGCVLYEMIFGAPPFYDRDHSRMYEAIKTKDVRLERASVNLSKNGKLVLAQMLKKCPEERLGSKDDIKELENHPFFETLDFAKLEGKQIDPPFIPNVRSDDDITNIDPEFYKSPLGESVQTGDIHVGVTTASDDNFVGFSYAPPIAEHLG